GFATVMSQIAGMRHYRYDQTGWWDNCTVFTVVPALVAGTFFAGGTASPLWFMVAVVATYASTLVVGYLGWSLASILVLGAAGSAWYNDQWTDGRTITLAVVIGVPGCFLLLRAVAQELYNDSEANMWARDLLAARVADLTAPLELAADGDLSVA